MDLMRRIGVGTEALVQDLTAAWNETESAE